MRRSNTNTPPPSPQTIFAKQEPDQRRPRGATMQRTTVEEPQLRTPSRERSPPAETYPHQPRASDSLERSSQSDGVVRRRSPVPSEHSDSLTYGGAAMKRTPMWSEDRAESERERSSHRASASFNTPNSSTVNSSRQSKVGFDMGYDDDGIPQAAPPLQARSPMRDDPQMEWRAQIAKDLLPQQDDDYNEEAPARGQANSASNRVPLPFAPAKAYSSGTQSSSSPAPQQQPGAVSSVSSAPEVHIPSLRMSALPGGGSSGASPTSPGWPSRFDTSGGSGAVSPAERDGAGGAGGGYTTSPNSSIALDTPRSILKRPGNDSARQRDRDRRISFVNPEEDVDVEEQTDDEYGHEDEDSDDFNEPSLNYAENEGSMERSPSSLSHHAQRQRCELSAESATLENYNSSLSDELEDEEKEGYLDNRLGRPQPAVAATYNSSRTTPIARPSAPMDEDEATIDASDARRRANFAPVAHRGNRARSPSWPESAAYPQPRRDQYVPNTRPGTHADEEEDVLTQPHSKHKLQSQPIGFPTGRSGRQPLRQSPSMDRDYDPPTEVPAAHHWQGSDRRRSRNRSVSPSGSSPASEATSSSDFYDTPEKAHPVPIVKPGGASSPAQVPSSSQHHGAAHDEPQRHQKGHGKHSRHTSGELSAKDEDSDLIVSTPSLRSGTPCLESRTSTGTAAYRNSPRDDSVTVDNSVVLPDRQMQQQELRAAMATDAVEKEEKRRKKHQHARSSRSHHGKKHSSGSSSSAVSSTITSPSSVTEESSIPSVSNATLEAAHVLIRHNHRNARTPSPQQRPRDSKKRKHSSETVEPRIYIEPLPREHQKRELVPKPSEGNGHHTVHSVPLHGDLGVNKKPQIKEDVLSQARRRYHSKDRSDQAQGQDNMTDIGQPRKIIKGLPARSRSNSNASSTTHSQQRGASPSAPVSAAATSGTPYDKADIAVDSSAAVGGGVPAEMYVFDTDDGQSSDSAPTHLDKPEKKHRNRRHLQPQGRHGSAKDTSGGRGSCSSRGSSIPSVGTTSVSEAVDGTPGKIMRKKLVVVMKRKKRGAAPSDEDEVFKLSLLPFNRDQATGTDRKLPKRMSTLYESVTRSRTSSTHSRHAWDSNGGKTADEEDVEERRAFRRALSAVSSRSASRCTSVTPPQRIGVNSRNLTPQPTPRASYEPTAAVAAERHTSKVEERAHDVSRRRRHRSRSHRQEASGGTRRVASDELAPGFFNPKENDNFYEVLETAADVLLKLNTPTGITPVNVRLYPKLMELSRTKRSATEEASDDDKNEFYNEKVDDVPAVSASNAGVPVFVASKVIRPQAACPVLLTDRPLPSTSSTLANDARKPLPSEGTRREFGRREPQLLQDQSPSRYDSYDPAIGVLSLDDESVLESYLSPQVRARQMQNLHRDPHNQLTIAEPPLNDKRTRRRPPFTSHGVQTNRGFRPHESFDDAEPPTSRRDTTNGNVGTLSQDWQEVLRGDQRRKQKESDLLESAWAGAAAGGYPSDALVNINSTSNNLKGLARSSSAPQMNPNTYDFTPVQVQLPLKGGLSGAGGGKAPKEKTGEPLLDAERFALVPESELDANQREPPTAPRGGSPARSISVSSTEATDLNALRAEAKRNHHHHHSNELPQHESPERKRSRSNGRDRRKDKRRHRSRSRSRGASEERKRKSSSKSISPTKRHRRGTDGDEDKKKAQGRGSSHREPKEEKKEESLPHTGGDASSNMPLVNNKKQSKSATPREVYKIMEPDTESITKPSDRHREDKEREKRKKERSKSRRSRSHSKDKRRKKSRSRSRGRERKRSTSPAKAAPLFSTVVASDGASHPPSYEDLAATSLENYLSEAAHKRKKEKEKKRKEREKKKKEKEKEEKKDCKNGKHRSKSRDRSKEDKRYKKDKREHYSSSGVGKPDKQRKASVDKLPPPPPTPPHKTADSSYPANRQPYSTSSRPYEAPYSSYGYRDRDSAHHRPSPYSPHSFGSVDGLDDAAKEERLSRLKRAMGSIGRGDRRDSSYYRRPSSATSYRAPLYRATAPRDNPSPHAASYSARQRPSTRWEDYVKGFGSRPYYRQYSSVSEQAAAAAAAAAEERASRPYSARQRQHYGTYDSDSDLEKLPRKNYFGDGGASHRSRRGSGDYSVPASAYTTRSRAAPPPPPPDTPNYPSRSSSQRRDRVSPPFGGSAYNRGAADAELVRTPPANSNGRQSGASETYSMGAMGGGRTHAPPPPSQGPRKSVEHSNPREEIEREYSVRDEAAAREFARGVSQAASSLREYNGFV